eukprot:GFUD01005931.1.p1 GENE.GFUD01005931.1~~GFUD01005931.1.p1  ORF type:complete len:302 (+),score=59.33 GFUD01005931.1:88-906(+)
MAGHFLGHVLGALMGRAIRDAKQERRPGSFNTAQTTFVRFENQNQEFTGETITPVQLTAIEVDDPQNPTFCSCFGLKSTIRTLAYIQILLTGAFLTTCLVMITSTTSDYIDSRDPQLVHSSWYDTPYWYYSYWSVAAAACVVLLWVSGLFIVAACLLVTGVKWGKQGDLDIWLGLNISGLVTSTVIHSLAVTVLFLNEDNSPYSRYAIPGMLYTLTWHAVWTGFAVLVVRLRNLVKDKEACQMEMTRPSQRSGASQASSQTSSQEVENLGYV